MRFPNATDMSTKTLLAKALYDNLADASDELSFRKGDIITVLERDVDGIVGWWLCSLHGNQGIAPGNRLKQISGPAPEKPTLTPQPLDKFDYDIPRAQWEGDDYDVPRAVNSPDYDIPKGMDLTMSNESSDSGNFYQEIYDVPLKDASAVSPPTSMSSPVNVEAPPLPEPFDLHSPKKTPVSKTTSFKIQDVYDVPGNLSASNTVEASPFDLHSPKKTPVSETTFFDTQDMYDVPGNLSTSDTIEASLSGASADDVYAEIYDIPSGPTTAPKGSEVTVTAPPSVFPKSKVDINHNKSSAVEEKSAKDLRHSTTSSDSGERRSTSSIENGKRQSTGSVDSGKMSSEDDDYVDYQEIYGFGGDKPVNVYDVPVQPQQISSEGQVVQNGGSKKTTHSILQRINMAAVKGVKVDRTAALQRVSKLEQAVDATVGKLLGYVTSTWRNPQILKTQIADIRDVAGKAKVALRLLTEFALGTLVNARNLPSQEMSGKLSRSVEPLLETYYSVKLALQRLDNDNWKTPMEKPENIHDDLDSIMVYMQSVPENSRKLVGVIRTGSTVLYRSSEKGSSHSKQHSSAAVNKAQAPIEDGRQNEVAAKLEKFGAPAMKAESSPVQSMTMMAGLIKEVVDANIKPKGNGRKLSPSTVRRLCGMDPPKSPTRRESGASSDGHGDGRESDEAPTLPARRPSEPPPAPPERKDSSERFQLIRQKSMDKPSAPPPKPKLNRKNTTRKSYKFPRFTAEQKKQNETIDTQESPVSNEVEPVRRKCNSDPAKIEGFKEPIDNNVSDSFNKERLTAKFSKQAHVHVSDSDLPKSFGNKQSTDSGLKSPTTQPLFDFSSGNGSVNGCVVSLTDAQLLEFYKYEIDTQLFLLSEAVKAFFASADGSQPPKVFVSNSKFIVLSAHKFVFIGDTLQKRVAHGGLNEQVRIVTNKLSDSIKLLVSSTKSAALHYPATNAMNEVTAAVRQVSESAKELHGLVKHTGGDRQT